MTRPDKEETVSWFRNRIVRNILQAARLKYLGYYYDYDEGHSVMSSVNDEKELIEYHEQAALTEGKGLLRFLASQDDGDRG